MNVDFHISNAKSKKMKNNPNTWGRINPNSSQTPKIREGSSSPLILWSITPIAKLDKDIK